MVRLQNSRYLTSSGRVEIRKRIRSWCRKKGEICLRDCKEAFGFNRDLGLHVLEYLDRVGFSIRKGDGRVVLESLYGMLNQFIAGKLLATGWAGPQSLGNDFGNMVCFSKTRMIQFHDVDICILSFYTLKKYLIIHNPQPGARDTIDEDQRLCEPSEFMINSLGSIIGRTSDVIPGL